MYRKKHKEISNMKCFVMKVTISIYYTYIFMLIFWTKDLLANAHIFFVKPLTTSTTSIHNVTSTIFGICHKKFLSAYTKKCQCIVEKSSTWKHPWNFGKRWLLCEKCPYSELFWSAFSRIQYKCGKILTRITPNEDTFYAVDNSFSCRQVDRWLRISITS